jgi:hypothetical protein
LLEKVYWNAVTFTSDHLTQTLTEFASNNLIKNLVVSNFFVVNETAMMVFHSISSIIHNKYLSRWIFSLIMCSITECYTYAFTDLKCSVDLQATQIIYIKKRSRRSKIWIGKYKNECVVWWRSALQLSSLERRVFSLHYFFLLYKPFKLTKSL